MVDGLPAMDESDKPIALWTNAELLQETARRGLMRVLEAVSTPLSEIEDPKDRRLSCEMGLGSAKLLASVQEAAMRTATDRGWDELLARIAQAKGGKK